MQHATTSTSRAKMTPLVLFAALLPLLPSCGILSGFSRAVHGKPAHEIDTTKLELEVMRLSDSVIRETSNSGRRMADAVGTPEAHYQAVAWSVGHTNHVLSIAANPNPITALVDLLLFTSVQRMLHEEYWIPEVYHEADQPMLESFQRLEASCWGVASTVLTEAQQEDVKSVLADWRAANPNLREASVLQPQSFSAMAKPAAGRSIPIVSDLFDLLNIDPLSNLEPAVREVAATRQLGERVFFFAQHMPRLLTQEVELVTLRTARMPEVRATLDEAERITQATEQFAAIAASLPEEVRAEREAAVCQIFDEITAQRMALFADIEKAREPVQTLLTESRATLEAGTRTTESLHALVGSFDTLVSRFEKSKPSPTAPTKSSAYFNTVFASDSSASPSKPFDVTEYGEAATRIGDAARELGQTIGKLDDGAPELQRTLDESAQRVERVVDHAYSRALRLVVWTIALLTIASLSVITFVRLLRQRGSARSTVG